VLVVNQGHPLARARSVSLAQLGACHLLVREHGSMTRKATETALDNAGVPLPASTVIGSREAICEAIRQGLGASVVPLGEVPRDPALCVVPFASDPPVLHEYLYCLQGRTHTRLIGAFLECLAPRAAA
jgi:DNA-binding transcriptional LysR family regulator